MPQTGPRVLYEDALQVAAFSYMITSPDNHLCRCCRALAWTQCSTLGQKQVLSTLRVQQLSGLELRQSRRPSPRMSQPVRLPRPHPSPCPSLTLKRCDSPPFSSHPAGSSVPGRTAVLLSKSPAFRHTAAQLPMSSSQAGTQQPACQEIPFRGIHSSPAANTCPSRAWTLSNGTQHSDVTSLACRPLKGRFRSTTGRLPQRMEPTRPMRGSAPETWAMTTSIRCLSTAQM